MAAPQLKDYLRESRLFTGRAIVAGVLVVLALGALVSRLGWLQIVNHDHYRTLSRDNRVKLVPLPPPRGLIYDRNGVLLAQNLPAYSLEITPEQVEDMAATLAELRGLVAISKRDEARFKRLRKQRRRFDAIPLKLRLTPEEVARIAVNLHRLPGVDINAQLLRDYPLGEQTVHALGYVGRINERELQQIDTSEYAGTRFIGKVGVEKSYESVLHGAVGMQQVEVNAAGRTIRVLERQPPLPGRDLYLNLDVRLQRAALDAFGEENGAAVAIDVNDGGVLALVSKPGFDPNLFVEGISSREYSALRDSPAKPLFNRALRGQYPPGSTLKPFVGLAGVELGAIGLTDKRFCPGFYQLPNHSHKYRDWKKTGHGLVNMSAAITQSCDVYFYGLAHDLGIDRLSPFLAQFNFGERTGIDLVGELPGLLPTREWKQRRHRQPWYPGETLIMGIGQGYFLATPLQLAAATAALANGGTYHAPQLVARIDGSANGEPVQELMPAEHSIQHLTGDNWQGIIDGMIQVVEGARGTARRLLNNDYRIAGKTGTAQVFSVAQDAEYNEEDVEKHMRDHALFIAFAPVEKPQIAVAVIVENGGHGGSVAAPIAKAIMDQWLLPGAAQ